MATDENLLLPPRPVPDARSVLEGEEELLNAIRLGHDANDEESKDSDVKDSDAATDDGFVVPTTLLHHNGANGLTTDGHRKIDRYTLMDLLGSGTMGEVYAAFDNRVQRKVALKIVRSDIHGRGLTENRDRLVREAQTLARLSHPNIARVYDVGTHEHDVYLALEFIEGQTLRDWLSATGEARSWVEVVEVMLQCGHALVTAHKTKIIHRDLKPDNIMVTSSGEAKVLDFGLAQPPPALKTNRPPTRGDSGVIDPTSLTALKGLPASVVPALKGSGGSSSAGNALEEEPTIPVGQGVEIFAGTPAYAAPEQYEAGLSDQLSDQYSFCVILYEALYGERPFSGANLVDLAKAVTSGKTRRVTPKRHVPRWLRQTVRQGLSLYRDERFPSMQALVATLERGLARQRRSRWVYGTLAVATAVGGGLLWLLLH